MSGRASFLYLLALPFLAVGLAVLVTVLWGFNVAANLTGREGYPIPYFRRLNRNGIPVAANVQITVRGPRSAMESLELGHGAVYIDAAGREPGTYQDTPAVDLPSDVELVKQEPASIELRILRQKRKADGR